MGRESPFIFSLEHRLIGEGKAAHARLDAQDVVVHCEHLLQGVGVLVLKVEEHLGVINTREVAGAGWLVLLWLQSEGVHVDAWVGGAAVVHIWLVLVEVLAELLLETVLAVEDQLEVAQRANLATNGDGALLDPEGVRAGAVHRRVGEQVGCARHVGQDGGGAGGGARQELQGVDGHVHVADAGGEVPHAVDGGGGGVLVRPDQLLHWVVEGQTDGVLGCGQGVTAGVLNLLDQVLVALLGEAAALLGVQVHVVGPHLEDGARRAEVVAEVAGQVEVEADLVVLQGNQGQVQAWVAVEEEQQGQVHVGLVGR